MTEQASSMGTVMVPDDEVWIPEEGQNNPACIWSDDGKVLLVVRPNGDVEIRDQEGLRKWAAATTIAMREFNKVPTEHVIEPMYENDEMESHKDD